MELVFSHYKHTLSGSTMSLNIGLRTMFSHSPSSKITFSPLVDINLLKHPFHLLFPPSTPFNFLFSSSILFLPHFPSLVLSSYSYFPKKASRGGGAAAYFSIYPLGPTKYKQLSPGKNRAIVNGINDRRLAEHISIAEYRKI
jgi:hypothetical protein